MHEQLGDGHRADASLNDTLLLSTSRVSSLYATLPVLTTTWALSSVRSTAELMSSRWA